ncbi:DUF222 domain-containing protein [Gordonia sputi]
MNSNGGNEGAPSALAAAVVGSADAVVAEKLSRLAVVLDELASVDVSLVSDDVLVEATVEAERLALRTAGVVTDRLIVEASDRDLPHSLGFRDIRNFMGQRLHSGDPAARYRVIAATGSFTTICGDRLPPACPTLAGYVADGRVAGAHVRAVVEVVEAIPGEVSAQTKAAAEAQMAGYAVEFTPAEITNLDSHRSPAQRNHDAFSALLGQVLESGMLGTTHRGLPIQVIVTTSLHELETQAGIAHTTSGTLLPIHDVIEMAATSGASHYLAVFGEHTSIPLYLGRSKRIASLGQRLASFASAGGKMCSAPGCHQPASRVQMHHAATDWADGGLTDIDQLVPACDVHNRRVGSKPGQFTTRMITEGPDTGRVAWRLNATPGMPENPERINRVADVKADFHDYLTTEHISNEAAAAARAAAAEIGIAADTADTEMVVADAVGAWMMSPPSTPGAPSVNEATLTDIELALAGSMRPTGAPPLSARVDIQWNLTDPPDPDPSTDPDTPTGPAPPASPWWLGDVDPPGGVDPPLADAA